MRQLHYLAPARNWNESLPLGNGRLGAMVFGHPAAERLPLNEDTLWSGTGPGAPNGTKADLSEARRLLDAGECGAAERYVEQHLTGSFSAGYLPLAELRLSAPALREVTDYRRALSLDDAVSSTDFTACGARHTREAFVSAPDQVFVLRWTADVPGAVCFELDLGCQLRHEVRADSNRLTLDVACPSLCAPSYLDCADPIRYDAPGIRARAMLSIETDGGQVTATGASLRVTGASSAIIRLCARTSYANPTGWQSAADAELAAAEAMSYDALKARHIADHRALFSRVSLDLGGDRLPDLPTDELLRKGEPDARLYELLFQYGHYLLICSSRPGTQAANLQGIWNSELRAPWSSNYTVNINTQMNYWPAECANLSELHGPLFDLIDRLLVTGKTVARQVYGARGAVVHHNTDLWGLAHAVGDGLEGCSVWAWWNQAFAWLTRHMMEHFDYTQDRAFLASRALPALRAAAQFAIDSCDPDETGEYRFYPASSPENLFLLGDEAHSLSDAAAMTQAITMEVLQHYLRALDVLGLDEPDQKPARELLRRLRPLQIGPDGRLLEWDRPYPEQDPHHRHTSHLYALHPAHLITRDTPDLYEACAATLNARGDDGTGWSLAWKINMWARLGDGDRAKKLLDAQLRLVEADTANFHHGGSYPNLLCAHPPFQIDGNFGATAGLCELFVRSEPGQIHILPALPSAWTDGKITGLRCMGGYELDIEWAGGALSSLDIRAVAQYPAHMQLHYGGASAPLHLAPGESRRITSL